MMKAKAEKLENNTVVLEIEVEPEVVDRGLERAYRDVVKKANIPGFRKGKAPRVLVERHFGKEYLLNEALDKILPDAYYEAVQETEIEPINRPQLELVQAEEGKVLIFKAKVEVKPEVALGEYKGLEAEKPAVEIIDADVDAEIEKLRQRYAKVNSLEEGEVASGDIAVIDFEGFVDGEAFPGGKGENYPLEIGSGSFIPGFEDQLVGAKVGEETEVKVNFPDEYHSSELAGKPATFKVKVSLVRRKELLPVDDELAKDVSEFDTLEELKTDVRNKLKEAAEQKAEFAVRDQVIQKAVANATVEIPEVMIDTRLNMLVNDMGLRLQRQGLSFEDYLKFSGGSMDSVRETLRPEAEKSVRSDLVLESIARTEGIDATDEELNAELEKLAEQYKQDVSTIRATLESQGSMENLQNSIAFQKTIQFLEDNAKINS